MADLTSKFQTLLDLWRTTGNERDSLTQFHEENATKLPIALSSQILLAISGTDVLLNEVRDFLKAHGILGDEEEGTGFPWVIAGIVAVALSGAAAAISYEAAPLINKAIDAYILKLNIRRETMAAYRDQGEIARYPNPDSAPLFNLGKPAAAAGGFSLGLLAAAAATVYFLTCKKGAR